MNVSLNIDVPAKVIIGKMTFKFPIRAGASLLVGVALLIAACPRPVPRPAVGAQANRPSSLRPWWTRPSRNSSIPVAVVLLRTPRRVHAHIRHHVIRRNKRTPRRHPLPDRLEYQDDDGRGDLLLPRKASSVSTIQSRSTSRACPTATKSPSPNAEYAQRPLHLRRRPRSGRSSTVTRPRSGPQPKCWHRVQAPPYFPPGTGFHYSEHRLCAVRPHSEKIDGKSLASCFQDRLFGPLGLKDTLLPAITSNTVPEPYSHGYFTAAAP